METTIKHSAAAGLGLLAGVAWFTALTLYTPALLEMFAEEEQQEQEAALFTSGTENDDCSWIAIDINTQHCFHSPAEELLTPPSDRYFATTELSRVATKVSSDELCRHYNRLGSHTADTEWTAYLLSSDKQTLQVRWVCPIAVNSTGEI